MTELQPRSAKDEDEKKSEDETQKMKSRTRQIIRVLDLFIFDLQNRMI